jgi:hypothetical protein
VEPEVVIMKPGSGSYYTSKFIPVRIAIPCLPSWLQ